MEKEKEMGEKEREESFETLFEERVSRIAAGSIIKGEVVNMTSNSVFVDIGYKADGVIPIEEFRGADGEIDVKIGDKVSAVVERVEGENGLVVLSRAKAAKMQVWEDIVRAYNEGGLIEGRITDKVKGGLYVDLGGVRAFLPGSQADIRPVKNMNGLLGKASHFKVLSYDRKTENVVVSRKGYLEEAREVERKKTLERLYEGAVVEGTVKNIIDFGAFVDVGGIDGLLHVNDISWKRIKHPSDVLKVGDRVTVKVLKLDIENRKISLGLKQTAKDPWEDLPAKYPVGTRVRGKVVNLTDFGAFVELEEGIDGMIHVSDMSWTKKVRHPSSVLSVGDTVEAVVLDMNPPLRKMALGLKQTIPNPWDILRDKYPMGSKVKGSILNITDFGVFVGIEEGIDGLVHLSDISWTKKIRHPSEVFKIGDEVEAVVLNIDKDKEKFSLGIKQLQRDPWLDIPSRYPKGSIVSGRVTGVTDFGVFIEIEEGIEGLVRESELMKEKGKKPSEVVKEGDILRAKVIGLDTSERKISLSVKAVEKDEEKAAIKEFFERQGSGRTSLGDILGEKLNNTEK